MLFSTSMLYRCYILLISACFTHGFIEPIGIAFGSIIAGTICRFKECCSESSIPANFNGLEETLQKRIYGQHLVQEIVVNALRSHWDGTHKPQKALTLSFHGWPGSGKNYVTRFIIENMYAKGVKSKFVHNIIGRIHFPSSDQVTQYQDNLYAWIKGNVSSCSKQLFIFDEVDKMPSQVLNSIKPMIDYRDDVDGIDYRDCIFIFLSNTGADLINEHFLQLWSKNGVKREHLKLKDFETLISKGAFNEEGSINKYIIVIYATSGIMTSLSYVSEVTSEISGFHHSDTIKSNLIDHYVPFLPMERRHVKLCILDEFKQRGVSKPQEEHINEAMEFVEWGPTNEKVFSTTGCKRISQKVGTIVAKYKLRN